MRSTDQKLLNKLRDEGVLNFDDAPYHLQRNMTDAMQAINAGKDGYWEGSFTNTIGHLYRFFYNSTYKYITKYINRIERNFGSIHWTNGSLQFMFCINLNTLNRDKKFYNKSTFSGFEKINEIKPYVTLHGQTREGKEVSIIIHQTFKSCRHLYTFDGSKPKPIEELKFSLS